MQSRSSSRNGYEDLSKAKLKKKEADVEKFEQENIPQQYDSLADAIQKEAIQNAKDARIDKNSWADWRIEITYDKENNVLSIRDFGTTGMDEPKFRMYNGIGWTDKTQDPTAGGSKGQGKAVFCAACEHVITETIDGNGIYRCSLWVGGKYDDAFHKENRELKGRGTLVKLYGVSADIEGENLREELQDDDSFVRLIQLTWNQILNEGARIIFKSSKTTVVPTLSLPPNINVVKKKTFENIEVKARRKTYGSLRNVVINHTDNDLPEDVRGISVVVRGQTIRRYIPPALGRISNRIFGSASAEFLKKEEKPNHSEFRNTRPWIHTKQTLSSILTRFAQPLMKRDREVSKKHMRVASNVCEEINLCLTDPDLADLNPTGFEPTTPPPPPPPPPEEPYVEEVTPDSKNYSRNENVSIEVIVVNGSVSNGFPQLSLETEIDNPSGERSAAIPSDEFPFDLAPSQTERRVFTYPIPDEPEKGRYKICVSLMSQDVSIDQKFSGFDVERPPRTKPTKRSKGIRPGGRKPRGLSDIRPFIPEEPEVPESLYDEDDNVVLINNDAPSTRFAVHNDNLYEHFWRCTSNELLKIKWRKDIDAIEEGEISSDDAEGMMNDLVGKQQDLYQKRAELRLGRDEAESGIS